MSYDRDLIRTVRMIVIFAVLVTSIPPIVRIVFVIITLLQTPGS